MNQGYKKSKPIWVADVDKGVFKLSISRHIVDMEEKEVVGYILNDNTQVMGIEFLNYGRRYSGSREMAESEHRKLLENQKVTQVFNGTVLNVSELPFEEGEHYSIETNSTSEDKYLVFKYRGKKFTTRMPVSIRKSLASYDNGIKYMTVHMKRYGNKNQHSKLMHSGSI